MADPKQAPNNMKDMVYPTGMTGENVCTEYLCKTAFPSPDKLQKLDNADAKGMYGSKVKQGK